MVTKSKTDYSDLNADPRAKSDSGLLDPEGEPADSNGFSLGTITIYGNLTADYLDDGSKSNNDVANNA
jgi:hypothetical protein